MHDRPNLKRRVVSTSQIQEGGALTDRKFGGSRMNQVYDRAEKLYKDSRSNLPGRQEFYNHTKGLFAEDDVNSIVLLTIEIDDLDFFLRMFGPVIRDDLIAEASGRIRESLTQSDNLFHITQFRFALVLQNVSHRQAINITKKLAGALKQPFNINGVAIHIPAVVGLSHYPNHAKNLYDLVRTVSFATHLARKNGTDYSSYDADADEWENYQFRLLKDIEIALDNDTEIKLAYQPIVNLADGSCHKFEGLCRWEHRELGKINPGDFLPYVEQSPLILPLTEVTLGLSLEFNKKLRTKGVSNAISVNLSTSLFQRSDLVQKLHEQFQFYNVNPENIIFEITETGIMKDPQTAIFTLNRLREMGCKIAIDDFGTGHSSLAYLADLPVDILKIDQCFIGEISKDRNKAIVKAATKIAESLDLEVVAEGIETEEQLATCKELGIHYGQGYYISRPVFSNEAVSWLEARG